MILKFKDNRRVNKFDILAMDYGDSAHIAYTENGKYVTPTHNNILEKDFDWHYANHIQRFAEYFIKNTDFLDEEDLLNQFLLYCVENNVTAISILYTDELGVNGQHGRDMIKTNILARGTHNKLIDFALNSRSTTVDDVVAKIAVRQRLR